MTKNNLGGNNFFFSLQLSFREVMEGTQNRKLKNNNSKTKQTNKQKQEYGAKATEECYWFVHFDFLSLLYIPGPISWDGNIHNGLGTSTVSL